MQHRIYESEEIKNIFTALGVSIGTNEDSKALNISGFRYHKIICMTDADVDGSHMTTLIMTFFYEILHISEKESHNKCINMRSINVGIGHTYNFMIS